MTTATPDSSAPKFDTGVPHSARVWNYWLGGKDNYAADREVGDQVSAVFPAIVENAQACRAYLELVEPGVVTISRWRPEPGADDAHQDSYGGVARKP